MKKIIALVLAAVLGTICFAATAEETKDELLPVEGAWLAVFITEAESTINALDFGLDIRMEFSEDGKVAYKGMGNDSEGTWEATDEEVDVTFGEKIDRYIRDGIKLVKKEDDKCIVFMKEGTAHGVSVSISTGIAGASGIGISSGYSEGHALEKVDEQGNPVKEEPEEGTIGMSSGTGFGLTEEGMEGHVYGKMDEVFHPAEIIKPEDENAFNGIYAVKYMHMANIFVPSDNDEFTKVWKEMLHTEDLTVSIDGTTVTWFGSKEKFAFEDGRLVYTDPAYNNILSGMKSTDMDEEEMRRFVSRYIDLCEDGTIVLTVYGIEFYLEKAE